MYAILNLVNLFEIVKTATLPTGNGAPIKSTKGLLATAEKTILSSGLQNVLGIRERSSPVSVISGVPHAGHSA